MNRRQRRVHDAHDALKNWVPPSYAIEAARIHLRDQRERHRRWMRQRRRRIVKGTVIVAVILIWRKTSGR